MRKYGNWGKWMIGGNVVELSTGDIGVIQSRAVQHGSTAVWIDWCTGGYSGQRLWLDLDRVEFINSESSKSKWQQVEERLAKIETLTAEIRVLLPQTTEEGV